MSYSYTSSSGYAAQSSRSGPEYRWWVPAEGISRQVIQAEIQRYLGPDALVKPGPGTGQHEGVPGYYIAAYRNLTTAMLDDLRKETQKAERAELESGQSGHYRNSPVYDAGRSGLGPTPPLPGATPAYAQQPAYAAHDQTYGGRHPAPQYAAGTYARTDQYQYAQQQVPYGHTPQSSVSPASNYAYTTNPTPAAPQGYPPYPSPPQASQYAAATAAAYPQTTPRNQYAAGYTQPQQQQPYYATTHAQAPAQAPSIPGLRPGYYLASDGRQYPIQPQ